MTTNSPPPSSGPLKVPKGTRDFVGQDLVLRDGIVRTIEHIFRCHGGVPLETPICELQHVLSAKYGGDSRSIYKLEDQCDEPCSLRYDLTVPFARWLAMNEHVKRIKRYQVANVYRKDQAAGNCSMPREYYQCDFDIAGSYDPMIPDAEILRIIVEVFRALQLDVTIRLNHRQIWYGLLMAAGVPSDKMRSIISSVNKLGKLSWADVRKEIVEKNGLPDNIADRVGRNILRKGPMRKMIDILKLDQTLKSDVRVKAGLDDFTLLLSYLEALDVADHVSLDLSLVPEMDYYTGLIYEVIPNPSEHQGEIGSVAAGGRYDCLVGTFGSQSTPSVGVSFRIDCIYDLLDTQDKKNNAELANETDVYIVAMGGREFDGLLLERLRVARELWDVGIPTEFTAKVKPKKKQQQLEASKNSSIMVILDQEELRSGQVRLEVIPDWDGDETRTRGKGKLILRDNLAEEVQGQLSALGDESKATDLHLDEACVLLLIVIFGALAAMQLRV